MTDSHHVPDDMPPFSLDFAWGRGFITRRNQALRYGRIDVVQSEIPDLRPSRTVLSEAEHFRSTRTSLCNLSISTTLDSLNNWVAATATMVPYADSAAIDVRDGALRLHLRVRAFGQSVETLSPILVREQPDAPTHLELVVLPGWVFGTLPAAAFSTVTRFLTDAIAASEPALVSNFARLQSVPCHRVSVPLVRLVAARAFLPSRWRLPSTDEMQIDGLFAVDDRLQIRAVNASFTRALALAGFESTGQRLEQPDAMADADAIPPHVWEVLAAGRSGGAIEVLAALAVSNPVAASLLAECAGFANDEPNDPDTLDYPQVDARAALQLQLRRAFSSGRTADTTEAIERVAALAHAEEDDVLLRICEAWGPSGPSQPHLPSAHPTTTPAIEGAPASLLRTRLEVIRQRINEFEETGNRAAVVADIPYAVAAASDDAEAPTLHELLARLDDQRSANDRSGQLVSLRALAAQSDTSAMRADFLARAGVLAYFDLEDDGLSLELLDLAVEADGSVLERNFEAISAWETLCRANDRADALLAVHDLRIKGASDPSMEAVHRLVKAGFLLHDLAQPGAAAREVDLVLDRDPVHVPALQLLAEAHAENGDLAEAWSAWLRLLQPGVLDDVERPGILEQAAFFATDHGRPEALELWWAVLEASPSSLVAYQNLRDLTSDHPAKRWLVVEQECAATLGVERSGVLRTLTQLDWTLLPESLQIHVQTLAAELIALRLDHQERLAWPWRAVIESMLRAPNVNPASWATAARLAMAAQWTDISDALWEGVEVWSVDPELLSLARGRGVVAPAPTPSVSQTIVHDVPMAAPSGQWPVTSVGGDAARLVSGTITHDVPMAEPLAPSPQQVQRPARPPATGGLTIVHEVPMARPSGEWEAAEVPVSEHIENSPIVDGASALSDEPVAVRNPETTAEAGTSVAGLETATPQPAAAPRAPSPDMRTITHDVPMARPSGDWVAARSDASVATPASSLAGAEAARSLAASIPSARLDTPQDGAKPTTPEKSEFTLQLLRLDAVAALDRSAALNDLEKLLRVTRMPADRCELLMRKGEWLVASGRGDDALQPLKGAYIYRAQDPNLRALLALAFAASGKGADARTHARAALMKLEELRFDPIALQRIAGPTS